MTKIFQFGEAVEGFEIPVLNEREIRAAAGILFFMMFLSIVNVWYTNSFTMLKFTIIYFSVDMVIRVLINPQFAPTLIVGRWFVRNQIPEYVGAPQKKFAWFIGLGLATIMIIHTVLLNLNSPISGIICIICLIFLFFETAFGICLGCKFYPLFFKTKPQHCSGEACERKARHEIQKMSWWHLLIVVGYVVFMVFAAVAWKDVLDQPPKFIWGTQSALRKCWELN